jgi:hypothetical protein
MHTIRQDDVQHWSQTLYQRNVRTDSKDIAHVWLLDADGNHCY